MVSRRKFLVGLVGAASVPQVVPRLVLGQRAIDRRALVTRHNPTASRLDPLAPLSVGNGTFAFTADVTGLQTLSSEYENSMPLCTMSQWGWHSKPRPAHLAGAELRLKNYDTHGRQVGYQTSSEGQAELFNWLRENPHRLNLVQIRFCRSDRRPVRAADVSEIEQELDLWRGVLSSRFKLDGQMVKVTTVVHPDNDTVAVAVESKLLEDNQLAVCFAFPYGSPAMQASDWQQPEKHQTTVVAQNARSVRLQRTLDNDNYFVAIAWNGAEHFHEPARHEWVLRPNRARLEFSVSFAAQPSSIIPPSVAATVAASASHWQRFWTTGGAIDLSGSTDSRAHELERRIVLSQYLTAIQCSGKVPPQETGLTVNSWYGKFHLEMHWWHAAHFPLWNRLPLLEQSLGWYSKILPPAQALAKSQGYAGARWPKMVGPEGRDSPSPIGPLLIWQQPHPIFYAELCYQSGPSRATLNRYREIVHESATFMASYAWWDASTNRYVLGPPVIPAQENHPPNETWNPTFELSYWQFGLDLAQRWRERLGLRRLPEWDYIITKLAKLPVREGVYLAHENCPQTYTERNHDHPSMLGSLGVLPGNGVDRETMRRTLKKTMKEWQWDQTWGWDYPMTAMTAARLGETEIAIDALLLETEKNRYLPNGHNWQRPNLPCYLPGNGGLLYAVALMAGGWKGSPREHAPGFPKKNWEVRVDGLNSRLLHQL